MNEEEKEKEYKMKLRVITRNRYACVLYSFEILNGIYTDLYISQKEKAEEK